MGQKRPSSCSMIRPCSLGPAAVAGRHTGKRAARRWVLLPIRKVPPICARRLRSSGLVLAKANAVVVLGNGEVTADVWIFWRPANSFKKQHPPLPRQHFPSESIIARQLEG